METYERRSAEAFGGMMAGADDAARFQLEKAREDIEIWIRLRLEKVLLQDTRMVVTPNNYHRTAGLSLQSFNITTTKDGRVVLPRDHFKAPTVGVISPDLLPLGSVGIAAFVPDQREVIEGLSNPGPRISINPRLPFAENNLLPSREEGHVDNPDAVRVGLLYTADGNPFISSKEISDELMGNLLHRISGVYGCKFMFIN